MRRFELTGPEVLVGGTSFQRLSQTILVRKGKLAVLADDDPRCSDLARSPYFREVGASDEAPAQTNPLTIPPNVETETPTPSADDVSVHEVESEVPVATTRTRKRPT